MRRDGQNSSESPHILLNGRNLHQLIGSVSHYLQGFVCPRWCRISEASTVGEPEISVKTAIQRYFATNKRCPVAQSRNRWAFPGVTTSLRTGTLGAIEVPRVH